VTLAPIALFVYRRLAHTATAVEALVRNPEAQDTDLVVFSDAARDAASQADVAKVRSYIRSISGFRSTNVVERSANLGLANSIMDGVSRLCCERGSVIVIEDDLVVAPGFLEFMNAALIRYRDEEKVMQVSGYMFPVKHPEALKPIFLTRVPTSWGWATWDRAWKSMELDACALFDRLKKANALHDFDVAGSYIYSEMLQRQAAGELDSWAIRWYASMFLAGGLCVRPSGSLVANTGFDDTGVHCGTMTAFDVTLSKAIPLEFPKVIQEDERAIESMAEFFRAIRPSWLRLVLSSVKQRLRGATHLRR